MLLQGWEAFLRFQQKTEGSLLSLVKMLPHCHCGTRTAKTAN